MELPEGGQERTHCPGEGGISIGAGSVPGAGSRSRRMVSSLWRRSSCSLRRFAVVRRSDSRRARAVVRLRVQRWREEGNQETVVSESIWIVVNSRTISIWLDALKMGGVRESMPLRRFHCAAFSFDETQRRGEPEPSSRERVTKLHYCSAAGAPWPIFPIPARVGLRSMSAGGKPEASSLDSKASAFLRSPRAA